MKEDPQPQLEAEFGLFITAKELRRRSSAKSTVAPRRNSMDESSTISSDSPRAKVMSSLLGRSGSRRELWYC